MDIKLINQTAKHFKGITLFNLAVNGKNAAVYGDNGTGKTTQFDAFLWLLFGKDSTDRSQFKVKPQDAAGNDIHNLQTEVQAELLVDGKSLKVKKMQEEKWTKKRGAAEAELTGNTISYWWDEVPVKEPEFKQNIGKLIDENIFRMITNPMYFSTRVSWQDRRKILLEICGDMSDAEVIASDSKLTKLTEILAGKSIEDYKKILNERIKGLEKERDNIKPRIDELMLQVPKEQVNYSETEAEMQSLKDILAGIESELADASKTADTLRKKQQELYGLKGKLDSVKARIDKEAGAGRKALIDEKNRLENSIYMIEADIKSFRDRITQNNKAIESNASERDKLLVEWKTLNAQKSEVVAETFVPPNESNFVCPTCGQNLPDDAKEEKLAEIAKGFEAAKKSKIDDVERWLAKNRESGLHLKSSTETLQSAIADYLEKIQQKESRLKEINSRIAEIDQELSKDTIATDYTADAEYVSLLQQIEQLQAELNKPVEDTTSALLQNKRETQGKIDICNKILNGRDVAEKTKNRIEELKTEERRISGLITELEGHKYLLEQFTVQKVNLLESSINNRFKFVRFKLFDQQINGGVSECCEALVNTNGSYVPFSEANHAGKVNAGLDIINTLCAYYCVTAPIFIDFDESVSERIETRSQTISLVKPETFVKLDKVLQDYLVKEHGSYEAAKRFWNDRNKTLRVEVEG